MNQVEALLTDVDRAWQPLPAASGKVRLHIIGSTALMMQTDYSRGTKDSDVLETAQLDGSIGTQLRKLAGKASNLATKHRIYVDVVPSGLPLLPHPPALIDAVELNATLRNFHVATLDVVDVVVSKLKRFGPNDIADIDAMVERGLVSHARLIARFESAVNVFAMGAGAKDIPRFVKNLNQIERDSFARGPTEIELPSWADG